MWRGKVKRSKMQIFNEIYITLNKILGEYGDLNIDELHESLVEIC